MITESKVANMGEFIAKFQQKIRELEAKLVPNTPSKFMEKRKTQVHGDATAIKDVEKYCAEVYQEVSQV